MLLTPKGTRNKGVGGLPLLSPKASAPASALLSPKAFFSRKPSSSPRSPGVGPRRASTDVAGFGVLRVQVIRARDLHEGDTWTKSSDAFVKVENFSWRGPFGRSAEQRTHTVEMSTSPVWRQTLLFEFDSLAEAAAGELKVTVWDEDKRRMRELMSLSFTKSDDFLGGCYIPLG